jgi:hypothetical protein
MSQVGIIDIESSHPQIPTKINTDGDPAIPIANELDVNGLTVENQTHDKALYFDGSGNIITGEIQLSTALAENPVDDSRAGLCLFDSSHFTIDPNTGYVQLSGGSAAIDTITVQNKTDPGTVIVVPDSGNITASGRVVAQHGTPIETHSSAQYEYTIDVQYADQSAESDSTKVGFAAFDSAKFSVNSVGFVTASGTGIGQTITGNDSVAISPTAGNWDIVTANSSPLFKNSSGSTLKLDFSDLTTKSLGLGTTFPSRTTATGVVAIGYQAGKAITTGDNNVFIGENAGTAADTGVQNVGIGTFALEGVTNQTSNVAIGYASLRQPLTGSNNVSVGGSTLNVYLGSNAVAIGHTALTANTSGTANTAVGYNALSAITTGAYNVAVGQNAGSSLATNDSDNILIGNAGTATDNNTIRIRVRS